MELIDSWSSVARCAGASPVGIRTYVSAARVLNVPIGMQRARTSPTSLRRKSPERRMCQIAHWLCMDITRHIMRSVQSYYSDPVLSGILRTLAVDHHLFSCFEPLVGPFSYFVGYAIYR